MIFQTQNMRLEHKGNGVAILLLDVAGHSINVLTRQTLIDLDKALDHVATASDVQRLIITSGKTSGFLAGADVAEFARLETGAEAAMLVEQGQALFNKLEQLPVPTLALIHGPCLGGGLELALACDYRTVIDHPKTQIGFPELELGLIPAWGGTQRLPRVVGLTQAMRMILGTKRLSAMEAKQCGLADQMIDFKDLNDDSLIKQNAMMMRQGGKVKRQGLPHRGLRDLLLEGNPLGRWLLFRGARRTLSERVPEGMPAPWEALEAIRAGVKQGMTAGLAFERDAAARLATTPACRNLVGLFFLRENARKLPAKSGSNGVPVIRKVGIVGAGVMGAGIAQLAILKGFDVVVQEADAAALDSGVKRIGNLLQKAAENRLVSEQEAAKLVSALGQTISWQGFDEVDLVVEAVVEDMDVKQQTFTELERRSKPLTLLASNTSSLLVGELQEKREHPDRIAGLHFFNPVHKMPLVEVVRGPATSEAAIDRLRKWAVDLGKMPVVVKDSPGFLVNRVLMPYLNEAVLLLRGGLGIELIDKTVRRFGMPMGPFELLDQVGLDVAAHIEKAMRPAFAERFGENPFFAKMVEKRWLGLKSGTGFYAYKGGKKQSANQAAAGLDRQDSNFSDLTEEDATDQLVLLMVNEAADCLGNSIVDSAGDVDFAMVFGTGWAPHRGGPLRYADQRGAKEIVDKLASLTLNHGDRFMPCQELKRRAESGENFYD